MSIKRKLAMSIATAVLGLILISGGTVAYFNDTESATNTFTTGLLELGINKDIILKIDDLVPGDTMHGDFVLTNEGTVDMKEIILHSSYEVVDKGESNHDDDLGDHISVEYLYNVYDRETVVFKKLLSELKDNPQQIMDEFPAGSPEGKFAVRFKFIDNGKDQNHFQTDELTLNWNFEAVQRDGDHDLQ
ncbi:TasA family protein [Metabacillus litoralis]|nr:TasA family protein [Metabacillus litoralis]